MSISKEAILAKVSSYDILCHFLQPYHTNGQLAAGKNISNPFLPEKQKTPSFNIFQANQNEWRYKDFATGDEGSCFDLVMNLFNIPFSDSLEIINSNLFLYLENSSISNFSSEKTIQEVPSYSIIKRPFSQPELNYWQKFGITEETLERFNVKALAQFSSVNKNGNPYSIKSNVENFIFAYENDNWVKLYKPLGDKQFRFQYLGRKESDFIFGWKQLPENGEIVFITGGEKDVMSLVALDFNAISLNSETAALLNNIANELKQRFRNVIVLYDNDETGIKHSDILAKKHNFNRLVLPEIPNNGKDIADFFSTSTKESFLHLLSSLPQITAHENQDFDKVVFNAIELMEMGNSQASYLMTPIFPQKGTAVLAGKPDTGKSQLARQLCIQIALGVNEFLGFIITSIYQSAIYVATEDNIEATTFLLRKQIEGLNQKPKDNLRFIFADTMEQEEILEELGKELSSKPADFVVIDSFGDIFTGKDSNNNMAMRNTVKLFDKIAKTHNCLILFVHHINKGAYRQAPGQEHIQGGSGLVQKVRLAIQLSEGEDNIRYFTVVKGNYCPKEYKQNAMKLFFSEETFLFTNTGSLVPIADLGLQLENDSKVEKYDALTELAQKVFKNDLLSYSKFTKEFFELTGKSISSAKRALADLKKLELIEEFNGSYRLATPSKQFFVDSEEKQDDYPF